MKKRRRNINGAVGIASLLMSTASLVWIGGFQFPELKHDMREVKADIREIKTRLDRMETDMHKLDIRVNKIEVRITNLEHQRKP